MALNGPWKGHVSTIEVKQEGTTLPCSASSRSMCIKQLNLFTALCMSLVTMKVQSMLIWGLQINFSRQADLQVRNLCIMEMDCIPKRSGLKQHTFILQFLWIRNPGASQLGLPSKVSHRLQAQCWPSVSHKTPSRFTWGRIDLQVHSHGGWHDFIS